MSSIGFPVSSRDEFFALARQIAGSAQRFDVSGGRYLCWKDPSGAELWLQVDDSGQLLGMSPHFSGSSDVRVALTASVERPDDTALDGAFRGWADPQNEDAVPGAYPFVFDCPNARMYDDVLVPSVARVQLAAFAHEVDLFDSPDAHSAAQTEELKFASQSFIPSGLFPPDGDTTAPPQAYAIITGHIREWHRFINSVTDEAFLWVAVETHAATVDVLMDPELVSSSPVVGGVLSGSFWLSGRLTKYPRKQRGLLKRLFGGKG